MSLNSKSAADMRRLAAAIRSAPLDCSPGLAASLMTGGLMRAQLAMRIPVRILRWRLKIDEFTAWWMLFNRFPQMAVDVVEGAAAHAERGRDTTSAASAGGFNANEVAMLTTLLGAAGVSPTPADLGFDDRPATSPDRMRSIHRSHRGEGVNFVD